MAWTLACVPLPCPVLTPVPVSSNHSPASFSEILASDIDSAERRSIVQSPFSKWEQAECGAKSPRNRIRFLAGLLVVWAAWARNWLESSRLN